jgi:hypothetical protein
MAALYVVVGQGKRQELPVPGCYLLELKLKLRRIIVYKTAISRGEDNQKSDPVLFRIILHQLGYLLCYTGTDPPVLYT